MVLSFGEVSWYYFGEKSLVASRLAVKDCSRKSKLALPAEGKNSSLHP